MTFAKIIYARAVKCFGECHILGLQVNSGGYSYMKLRVHFMI